MKQHITPDQLNELSDKGKEKLREWWKPVEGDQCIDPYEQIQTTVWCCEDDVEEGSLPLLSIGQMIEFLDESEWIESIHAPQHGELNKGDLKHKDDDTYWEERDMSNPYNWQVYTTTVGSWNTKELCDALWEAVKEVIEDGK